MESLKLGCQLFIVLRLVLSFFALVYRDFNGVEARPPKGFAGFVATFIETGIALAAYYAAGCFTEIVP